MTIDEMKERKRELGLSNRELSVMSGVPEPTIQKIFSNETTSPRRKTIIALERVLSDVRKTSFMDDVTETGTSPVKETVFKYASDYNKRHDYPNQGSYTVKDYYNLPDDQRVELIDGVIYDMTAPLYIHQLIISKVMNQLINYTDRSKHNCDVLTSPIDVQLDCDDRTMVQPDIVILCDQKKNTARNIYGAPDFVLEVLSESTRRKDLIIKLNKYMTAGCREYWIIDPESCQVIVYDFENGRFPLNYSFDDDIPVNISGGECKVNLRGMRERAEELADPAAEELADPAHT